jgi:hypothetical protein
VRKPETATGTAKPEAEAKDVEPSLVRFGSVERSGPDEEGAKRALQIEVERAKARASDECQREHESFGSCAATKLSTKAALLSSLDFSARKELQKALTEECRAQMGSCTGVESSPPVCREIFTAQATPPPGNDKKGDGKKK